MPKIQSKSTEKLTPPDNPRDSLEDAVAALPELGLIDLSGIGAPMSNDADYIRALFMGDPGTGKTSALASMAHFGLTIIVDVEGGLKKGPLKKMGIPTENIRQWPDYKAGEVVTYAGLENLIYAIKAQLEESPGSIAGVMIDSATELAQVLLREIREIEVERAESKGKPRQDSHHTELQDYGTLNTKMITLIGTLKTLPCHFGVSTFIKKDVDGDESNVFLPDLSAKLATYLWGAVDIAVVTTSADNKTFVGITRAHKAYKGKDRFNITPPQMANPSFFRLQQYVTEELTVVSDPEQQALIASKKKKEDDAE